MQKTDPSKVKLMYNTNGTQRINDKTKSLIEQFKFARISFSIDGTGKQFEYLRYPADWPQVQDNLYWWKNNLPHNSMLSLTVTASILNVLTLDQVFEWHGENFSKSKFGDEIEIYVHQAFGKYGLEYMPQAMVDHFRSLNNYCQPWIQKLSLLGIHADKVDQVTRELRVIDQRRKLNFSEVMPVAAKFINY